MEEGCPALLGYIAATAKPTADVILESDNEDPILTTWQYGLGRTVAWNSDGNNQWTAQYATWDNYPMLWSNIIQYVVSDTELGEDTLEVTKEGNTAVISYATKEYDRNTKVQAVITDENGTAKEITLDALKPGTFETTVDMEEIGVYNVSIRKLDGEEITKNYNTAYSNQYSVEYQFTDTKTDLTTFTKQAGGVELTLEDSIWNQKQETVKAKMSLTVPLLIFSMILFLIDIIIRRFSVDLMFYVKRAGETVSQKWRERKSNSYNQLKKSKKNADMSNDAFVQGDECSAATTTVQKTMEKQNLSDTEMSHTGVMGQRKETKKVPAKKAELKKASKQQNVAQKDKKSDNQNEKLDMNALLKKKQERNQ